MDLLVLSLRETYFAKIAFTSLIKSHHLFYSLLCCAAHSIVAYDMRHTLLFIS